MCLEGTAGPPLRDGKAMMFAISASSEMPGKCQRGLSQGERWLGSKVLFDMHSTENHLVLWSFAGQLRDCLPKWSDHPTQFHWLWVKWSVLDIFASNCNFQIGLRVDRWIYQLTIVEEHSDFSTCILLGHYNLFRLTVDNTGLRAVLQTPLAKQEICGKAHCQPRTASQNPPCSAEQAGHVLCDSSKVCGQVAQVSRSRRTSPFLKSTVAGNQKGYSACRYFQP